MGIYALVKDGLVINTILWDGPDKSPIDFDDDVTVVEVKDGVEAGIGYTYSKNKFIAPPLSDDQLAAQGEAKLSANVSEKENRMAEASQRIAVLQDAVDLEMSTDEEAASLPLWKKYRVLLSRINANTSDTVNWPEIPAL